MEIQRYEDIVDNNFRFRKVIINPGKTRHIVAWHGLGASPEVMFPLLEWLAVMLNVTIIALLMPCHGESDDVDTYDDFIKRIGEWCVAVGLDHDLVIGHSLGALALPPVAELCPDQIGAMLCMSMPTEPLSGRLDLVRRLFRVGTNATTTTASAWFEAWMAGSGLMYGRAVRKTASDRFRLHKMIKVLLDTPDLGPVLSRSKIPAWYTWGGLRYLHSGTDRSLRFQREDRYSA